MSAVVKVCAAASVAAVVVAESAAEAVAESSSDLLVYINELSSAAVESLLAIKPLFHFQAIDNVTTSKMTADTYTHIFGFERLFESRVYVDSVRGWMAANWFSSIIIACVYMLAVALGTAFMRSRERFELRAPLIVWNLALAIFSITGAARVLPEFLDSLDKNGLTHTVCNNDYAHGISGFWAFMFIMSKLPELVDTVFIVLRKQKLIFLHWYHHATVLAYCWYSYKDHTSTGRWFMTMNYFVHSLMYSYYALKAMRVYVPRGISQLITAAQILQMMAGIGVNVVAWQTKSAGGACAISTENIKYSLLMYVSYFVLFAHFFLNAYVFSKAAPAAATARVVANGKPINAKTTKKVKAN